MNQTLICDEPVIPQFHTQTFYRLHVILLSCISISVTDAGLCGKIISISLTIMSTIKDFDISSEIIGDDISDAILIHIFEEELANLTEIIWLSVDFSWIGIGIQTNGSPIYIKDSLSILVDENFIIVGLDDDIWEMISIDIAYLDIFDAVSNDHEILHVSIWLCSSVIFEQTYAAIGVSDQDIFEPIIIEVG